MHIIITAGGSGGHVFPALEVAKELQTLSPKPRITFVGNRGGFEERMAKSQKLAFFAIKAKPITEKGLLKKITALIFMGTSVLKCLAFLLKNRPQAVIGLGGYVSAPMVMASFFLNIPRFICEQNVVPGNANKMLARFAQKVFLGFEAGINYFPKDKCIYSGNPTRSEFFALPDQKSEPNFRILVLGGSQGATILNQEVPLSLTQILSQCPHLSVTHQTGTKKNEGVIELYQNATIKAQVYDFITEMPQFLANHDLIISRAGAMACAEILAAGKPAILVPYRFAGGHQKDNALALVTQGAGIMVEEGQDFATRLAKAISTLYSDATLREGIAQKARKLAKDDAAKIIVRHILKQIAE